MYLLINSILTRMNKKAANATTTPPTDPTVMYGQMIASFSTSVGVMVITVDEGSAVFVAAGMWSRRV